MATNMPPRPPDPETLLDDIGDRSKRVLKMILITLSSLVLALTGAVVYLLVILSNETQSVISTINENATSQCAFYGALGSIPLPAKPFPARRTVQVVAASRGAYTEHSCKPHNLPSGPVLREAGRRYGININPK
jgi:hypothetical protein